MEYAVFVNLIENFWVVILCKRVNEGNQEVVLQASVSATKRLVVEVVHIELDSYDRTPHRKKAIW